MKHTMLINNCEIVICEVNVKGYPNLVLPVVKFNNHYIHINDIDMDDTDYNLVDEIMSKLKLTDGDNIYSTWDVDVNKLDRRFLAIIDKVDSIKEFNKRKLW